MAGKYDYRITKAFDEGLTLVDVRKQGIDYNLIYAWERRTGKKFKRQKEPRPYLFRQLYSNLHKMHGRCYDKRYPGFPRYGAKGIGIAPYWNFNVLPMLEAAQNFFDFAMATGYKKGLTFDRKDNSKGYSKENFNGWKTYVEQAANRTKPKTSKYIGVSWGKMLKGWVVAIRIQGRCKTIACFDSELRAAKCYDAYVVYHGLRKELNFPNETPLSLLEFKPNFIKSRGKKSSRFRGVSWHKRDKKWQANIVENGKYTYLGSFDDEKEAAIAWDAFILEQGLNRRLNFPI